LSRRGYRRQFVQGKVQFQHIHSLLTQHAPLTLMCVLGHKFADRGFVHIPTFGLLTEPLKRFNLDFWPILHLAGLRLGQTCH
jgi:hypothetical protein